MSGTYRGDIQRLAKAILRHSIVVSDHDIHAAGLRCQHHAQHLFVVSHKKYLLSIAATISQLFDIFERKPENWRVPGRMRLRVMGSDFQHL